MSSVAVIGAGAWGTALAIQAARAGNDGDAVGARSGPRRGDRRKPGEPAPARRAPARDDRRIVDALPDAADAVLLAVPMQHLRGVLARLPTGRAPLVVCAKGVEHGDAAPAAGNRRRRCDPARRRPC